MRRTCTFQLAITIAVILFLGINSDRTQAQTTLTPRASTAGVGTSSPISPFLFGPPAYPYRATAPSSYRGTSLPDQSGGGVYRGPSLSVSASPPSPTLALTLTPRRQPAIGAFIHFGQPPSLLSMDSTLLPGGRYHPAADQRAHISLYVPADAQVWFNNIATKQTGKIREFHSPELAPNKAYHYEVRIRWKENGDTKERKQRIDVKARDWLRFDFTRPTAP